MFGKCVFNLRSTKRIGASPGALNLNMESILFIGSLFF